MLLGIEIGGTKLQLGVGDGSGPPLVGMVREDVDAAAGAERIREQIVAAGKRLIAAYDIRRIGIGFGGPVAPDGRHTVRSHQVAGWENFPLVEWVSHELGRPAVLGNDADLAGLAEVHYGAGRGSNPLFYITVGTGLGGGLIVDGRVYRGSGRGAAEIGHLRPGPSARATHETVEACAAGPGIVASARAALLTVREDVAQDLLSGCGGVAEGLTAKLVGEAAARGNPLALASFDRAMRVLGWGVAQTITLVAPAAVVIGGGVSLVGERLFFEPLRKYVDEYVFPPFRGSCPILPAQLGEEMVVHGALALAAAASGNDSRLLC